MTLLECTSPGIVRVIALTASTEDTQRLHAIGIYTGASLTATEPAGSTHPIQITIDSYSHFAISRALAACIHIQPQGDVRE